MSADQRPARDEDADPTGVRELLASLPEPGPMPEHLVRRIEARLEVERQSLGQPSHALGRRGGQVVDLAAERGRRRPVRTVALLGGVAAGLVVATLAIPQLLPGGSGSPDTAAHYPSAPRSGADAASDAAGGEAREDAGDDAAAAGPADDTTHDAADGPVADAEAAPDVVLEPDSTATGTADMDAAADGSTATVPLDALVVLGSLGEVTPDSLTQDLVAALDTQDAAGGDPDLAAAGLTPAEAQACWGGLAAAHDFERYAASRALLVAPDTDSVPVVALLGVADGQAQSWAVPEACAHQRGTEPLLEGQPLARP